MARFASVKPARAAAAELLLAIRDSGEEVVDLVELLVSVCGHWNGTPGAEHAGSAVDLVAAGYLEAFSAGTVQSGEDRRQIDADHLDGLLANSQPPRVLVRATPKLKAEQRILGFSLNTIVREKCYEYIQVNPIFPKVKSTNVVDVAILMPFAPDFDEIHSTIAEASTAAGFSSFRCDSNVLSQNIVGEIFDLIQSSRVVIADLSNLNANVMYELGISHTLGKTCILLANKDTKLPFDISHLRYLSYDPDDLHALRENLASTLMELGEKI